MSFPYDLLLLLFNHPYIFQVKKEPVDPLDPKVCWPIKYLLWLFSLDSFWYGYCPWVLPLSIFGFFFCALIRKQTLFSLMEEFYNEAILQNASLFLYHRWSGWEGFSWNDRSVDWNTGVTANLMKVYPNQSQLALNHCNNVNGYRSFIFAPKL